MTQFTPLSAILIVGCIVLSGAVIYRYLYSGWTRIRTALRLGIAGGGIGYAIVAANGLKYRKSSQTSFCCSQQSPSLQKECTLSTLISESIQRQKKAEQAP